MSKFVEIDNKSSCSCPTIEIDSLERDRGAFVPKRKIVRNMKAPADPRCSIHGDNRITNYGNISENVRDGWRPL